MKETNELRSKSYNLIDFIRKVKESNNFYLIVDELKEMENGRHVDGNDDTPRIHGAGTLSLSLSMLGLRIKDQWWVGSGVALAPEVHYFSVYNLMIYQVC